MNSLGIIEKSPAMPKPTAQTVTVIKKHMLHTAKCKPLDGCTMTETAMDIVVISQNENCIKPMKEKNEPLYNTKKIVMINQDLKLKWSEIKIQQHIQYRTEFPSPKTKPLIHAK